MDLRLGAWYRYGAMPDTLALALARATGLGSVTEAELAARDPDLAVLHPVGEYRAGDTLLVAYDWIRLTGGDGDGWWGQDYKVGFLCGSGCCDHVGTRLSGSWN
jgi:hypothetical protein